MAVWVFAYGKNNLINQIGEDNTRYLSILNSLNLDEVKILDSIVEARSHQTILTDADIREESSLMNNYIAGLNEDEYRRYLTSLSLPYIAKTELAEFMSKRAEENRTQEAYNFTQNYNSHKTGAIKSKWEIYGQDIFINNLGLASGHDGIKCSRINDLIWVTGPFDVFSVYGRLQSFISTELREYYHDYFKRIMRAFGSDFIVYGHEWSCIGGAEDDNEFNSEDLMRQIESAGESSSSIHTMSDFYYESWDK